MRQVRADPKAGHLLPLMGEMGSVLSQAGKNDVFRRKPSANSFNHRHLPSVNIFTGQLVAPHSLGDLAAAILIGLDLARKSIINVDGNGCSGQSTDSLVEMSRHTGNQCNQVG